MFFNQYPYINENDLNLDYILKHIKELMARVTDLEQWQITHKAQYEQLKLLYDQIISGNFTPEIIAAFEKWMNENALDLVGQMVKQVYFGLNDDGYFIVNIPQNWRDLVFKTTGYDYNTPIQPEYGHLCLLY